MKITKEILIVASFLVVAVAGCLLYFSHSQQPADSENYGKGEKPVYKAETLQQGYGAIAVKSGDKIMVNYIGILEDNTLFDSNFSREAPYEVFIGKGEAPLGWDEGLLGMMIGEKRKIVVPADYAGSGERGNAPENTTLYYEVELLDIG